MEDTAQQEWQQRKREKRLLYVALSDCLLRLANHWSSTVLDRYVLNVIRDPTVRWSLLISFYKDKRELQLSRALTQAKQVRNGISHMQPLSDYAATITESCNTLAQYTTDTDSLSLLQQVQEHMDKISALQQAPLPTLPVDTAVDKTLPRRGILAQYKQLDKAGVKGRRIRIETGKHSGKEATLVSWSGTAVKVLVDGTGRGMVGNRTVVTLL